MTVFRFALFVTAVTLVAAVLLVGIVFLASDATSSQARAVNPCYPARVLSSYWDDDTPKAWHTQLRDYQCSDRRVVFVREP